MRISDWSSDVCSSDLLHVALGRLVEGRAHHLALHRAVHIRDLLRALVDEQHDEKYLRVVLGDRLRDVLQDHGLAGARRRDDEGALALADRRSEEHTSELQSLMRNSYAVFGFKKK